MREELVSLSIRLGLTGRIHFAGYQPHPEHYLSAMDLFVLTSRTEGMPLSVLEAWAAGLPVIASRVGGIPKLIDDDRTGLLFSPGDVDGLVKCFVRLLDNPEVAKALGAAGSDEVHSRYSVTRMTHTYLGHYEELVRRKPAAKILSG